MHDRPRRKGGFRYPRLGERERAAMRKAIEAHFGSTAEAARQLHRAKSGLGYWLNGSQGLPPEEFEQLAALMGTSADELQTRIRTEAEGELIRQAEEAGRRAAAEEAERQFADWRRRQEEIARSERQPVIPENVEGRLVELPRPLASGGAARPRMLRLLDARAAAGPADDVDYLAQTEGEVPLPREIADQLGNRQVIGWRVEGDSLAGLGILDGMVVVAEPVDQSDAMRGRGYRHGNVVLALAWSGSEPAKLYLKQFRETGPYPPGLWSVRRGDGGRVSEVHHEWEYRILARVLKAFMPIVDLDA